MPVKFNRFNMTEIKDRVGAAELLQQSGQDEQAEDVLIRLANELLGARSPSYTLKGDRDYETERQTSDRCCSKPAPAQTPGEDTQEAGA